MSEKILVIGASGNLGQEVVRQLISQGKVVRAATRRPEPCPIKSESVEMVTFDFDRPDTYDAALSGVTRLFLIAPPLDPQAPQRIAPFIDSAREAKVERIVFNSALGVDKNDEAPLRLIERQIEASGLNYTFLRPNFFMENFSRGFISPMITNGGGVFVAADQARTSFISVEDIAEVAVRTLTEEGHEGRAYNLTGPSALDHAQVTGVISEVSGRQVVYQPIPEGAMVQGAIENGLSDGEAKYLAMLYQMVRAGYMEEVIDDVQQVLGRPQISFGDFARRHAYHWN